LAGLFTSLEAVPRGVKTKQPDATKMLGSFDQNLMAISLFKTIQPISKPQMATYAMLRSSSHLRQAFLASFPAAFECLNLGLGIWSKT
jgi:hypothetical protein